MSKRYVTAYFLHEHGKAEAMNIMGAGAESTDSFVLGEVDDEGVKKLQDAGLIVQDAVPQEPPAIAGDAPRPPSFSAAAASVVRHLEQVESDAVPAQVDYYTLVLHGPLIESWRSQLEHIGVRIIEAHRNGYKVRLRLDQLPQLRALDFVASVNWIAPRHSAPKVLTRSVSLESGAPVAGTKMLTFDVRIHEEEDRAKVEQWLKDRHLAISGSSGRKIRFFALEDAPELADLAALPEVDRISEYVPPKLSNDVARQILGIDSQPNSPVATSITHDGSGQIVGVADTGIDDKHPDFQGRIVGIVARGRQNDASDPHGHGTHVAGSVLGDGSASRGQIRGAAPKAQLFFQSLLDSNGGLGGLPLDLNDLFEEAYQVGARIHNNSWGAETPSVYSMNSEEVDEFVRKRPDMLVLIAAGNAGSAKQPQHTNTGYVDWLSIGSPASCKNALTVGASRSNRTDGSKSNVTYGTAWPLSFPDPPISNENISGDPECMAAFSGRGPCDDYRIKPDLVSPGTDILSTKSSLAPIGHFWGRYPADLTKPADPNYAFDGGTSMATPLASGCAALVRQYYVDGGHEKPSAALLKATLINGTKWLTGNDSTAPANGTPNYHQGHGRICMQQTIPNAASPQFKLQFVDDWENPASSFTRTGERRRYQFALGNGAPELRICMAYTDAPARALQNNLNLIVQHLESGTKWIGNSSLPCALTPLDTANNVETVRITNAPAGNYLIQIVASNLLKPPQDFALVVTGNDVLMLNPI